MSHCFPSTSTNSLCNSNQWHADELFVKLRDGSHMGAGIGMVWNFMDRETRFLVVSKLATDRSASDTTAAIEEAANDAHGIKPATVFYRLSQALQYRDKNGVSRGRAR